MAFQELGLKINPLGGGLNRPGGDFVSLFDSPGKF